MKKDVYIACEDVNFLWTYEQVQAFDKLWFSGVYDVAALSDKLKRPPADVAFLIFDRAQQGYILPRGKRGFNFYTPPH